jgi:hypothetical protein
MSDTTTAPTVTNVKRHAGIAGQYEISADVTYEGEKTTRARFVGSSYGGPVVMILPNGTQTFVREPERFGPFGEEWVRRLFS